MNPLHQSQIADLLICPKRYEFRYIKGVESPPNERALLGTAVHAAIEAWYSDKSPDEAVEAILEPVEAVPRTSGDGSPAPSRLARALWHSLFGLWERWPDKPTDGQAEVYLEGEAGRWPIAGTLDYRNHQNWDWKTAEHKWNNRKLEDSWLQATAYFFLTDVPRMSYVTMSYDPLALEEHRLLVEPEHQARFLALLDTWAPLVSLAEAGAIELPIRPRVGPEPNWLCSKQWCPFWNYCPGGRAVNLQEVPSEALRATETAEQTQNQAGYL